MTDIREWLASLAISIGICWIGQGSLTAQEPKPDLAGSRSVTLCAAPKGLAVTSLQDSPLGEVALEQFTPEVRAGVRRVLTQPTLALSGPTERFLGDPQLYTWLLDHPDRAVGAWRKLGAKCHDITPQNGQFFWTDGQGTQIHWIVLLRNAHARIWYAEGSSRPAPFLPTIPVRAVVVLTYDQQRTDDGRVVIRHQADLFGQTDSKTAALVARLLGPSAPRLAAQCLDQLEMFFSALVWYVGRHPEAGAGLGLSAS